MIKVQHITTKLLKKYKFRVTIPAGWSFKYDDAKFKISDDLFDAMTLGICEVLTGAYNGPVEFLATLNGTDYTEIPSTKTIRGGMMTTTFDVKHKTVTLDSYRCEG